MKKFIFTRFGVNNFKTQWFGWRTSVIQSFTLQGIEQNDDNELYWVIFINKDAPVNEKLRLNQIIDRSKSRRAIYLVDIEYLYEIRELAVKFVNEHAAEGERVMLAQCDADDVYSRGFLKGIEELDQEQNDSEETVLFTFPYGYRFLLMEKIISPWVEECRSMNNFIITTDRSVSAFESPHHLYREYYEKKGRKVIVDETLKYMWFKTESPDNVDTIYNDKKYEICQRKVKNSEGRKDIYDVADMFGLSKEVIDLFYAEYPELPSTSEAFIYKNALVDIARKAQNNCRSIKKIFIEFSTDEFVRTRFHKYLCELQQKYNMNGLEALGVFWNLPLKTDKRLLKAQNINKYANMLKPYYDDVIICLAVSDDASKYYDAFFQKNGFGLKINLSKKFRHSYAAILDFQNNRILEKCGLSKVILEYVYKSDEHSQVKFSVASLGFSKDKKRGASVLLSSQDTTNKKANKDDREYCLGMRGLNVVVYSKSRGRVIDTFNVDFYKDEHLSINRNFVAK